uniref:Tail protein n=1 Tax=Siphoviridae sp. ctDOT22 TaxID=2827812 RepID=A0A8S5SVG1_9CAUD|nr:MAG TPA: tail protein [Siphoviridae sp. ctDOT22]
MIENLKSLVVRIATLLKQKVDKVSGKSLVSDSLITKLEGLEKVTSSKYLSDNKLQLTLSDNTTVVTTNTIDLSGYVQKETGKSLIENTLKNQIPQKVDKVNGKGLLKSTIATSLETNWENFEKASKKFPTALAITGTDTKKIVLTLNDSTTLESQWVDLKGEAVDFSGAGFDKTTGVFKINSNTQFSLDGRYRLLTAKIPWSDIQGAPTIPTLPSWVGNNKPTYNWSEIQNKPSLDYLPLTGGTINPGNVSNYQEGIRINKATNNWSTITLGTEGTSGIQSGAWAITRNPSGEFQIGQTSGANSGLRLSSEFPYWKGSKIWNSKDNVVEGEANLETGRDVHKDSPLYIANLGYDKVKDQTYNNALTFGGSSGRSQLILPWFGGGGLYFRTLRDVLDNWTEPERIYSQRDNLGSSNMLRGNCHVPFTSHNFYINNTQTLANKDSEGNLKGQFPDGLIYRNPDKTEWVELETNTWYTISIQIKANKDVYLNGGLPIHYHYRKRDDISVNALFRKVEIRNTQILANKWTTLRTSLLTGSVPGKLRLFIFNNQSDAEFSIRYICFEQGNSSGGYKPTQDELSGAGSGSSNSGVSYTRITDAHNWLNSPGKIFAADGDSASNSPTNNWYHFFGGTHTNTQNYNYQFALRLDTKENTPLFFKKRDQTGYSNWYQIPMFQNPINDYADIIKSEYAWHYTNIGNGFKVYQGNIGQGRLRLHVNDDGVNSPIRFDSPVFRLHYPGVDSVSLHSKDTKLNVTRNYQERNAPNSDYTRVKAEGYEIPNGTHKQVLLANGESKFLGYGQQQEINLIGLPEDKYFLIYTTIQASDRCKFRVHTALDGKSKPSWAIHGQGFSLEVEFEQTGHGWGTIDTLEYVNYYSYGWANVQPAMFIGQLGNNSRPFIYLRGGGFYTFYSYSMKGAEITWENPRTTIGEFEGQPYCRDWADELEILPRAFFTYKNQLFGKIVETRLPIKTKELMIDTSPSNTFNIYSDGNEMNVASRILGGYTKVRASGYKVMGQESTKNILLADGTTEPYSHESAEIGGDWGYTKVWKNNLIYVVNPCNINLNNLENWTGLSFINLHNGTTTFSANGINFIYLGAPSFQGNRGTSCTVNRRHNEIFVHVNKI